jgi:hypothetical protein
MYNKTKMNMRYALQLITKGDFGRLTIHKIYMFKTKNCHKAIKSITSINKKEYEFWVIRLGSCYKSWVAMAEKNNNLVAEDLGLVIDGVVHCEASKAKKEQSND